MPSPLNVPITPPRVAFIDPRSGNVSREWYLFFLSLFQSQGGSSISLDDVQKGPPALTLDEVESVCCNDPVDSSNTGQTDQIAELQKQIEGLAEQPSGSINQIAELQKQIEGLAEQPFAMVDQIGQMQQQINEVVASPITGQTDQIAELQKQVEGLAEQPSNLVDQLAQMQQQISDLQQSLAHRVDQIAELQKQIEGVQLTPPPREFKRSRYGQFYDTTTQIAAAINTPAAITFNTSDVSNGVYLGTPSSRVYVDTDGVYNVIFSIQLDKTSGGTGVFWVWPRVNGVDLPDSNSQVRIQGNDAETLTTVGYFLELVAGDYFEVMFAVDDVSVEVTAFPASAFYPSIPSIILTVTDNIQGVQ